MNADFSVKNNIASLNTQNILNKNITNLEKTLQKLSSGMKINSAQDGASAYAISEKIRTQLKALHQAADNAQNGTSLLKVAEGGLSTIKEMVGTMKEMAIDAANDTNTQSDRAIMEKELIHLKSEINTTAHNLSFNSLPLLDGSFEFTSTKDHTPEGLVLRGLNTWWITEGIDLVRDSFGLDFGMDGTNVDLMDVAFDNTPGTGTLASISFMRDPLPGGKANKLTLTVNMPYFNNITAQDTNGTKGGNLYLDRVIAHELTHAVMSSNEKTALLPLWYIEGSAEVNHGADSRIDSDLRSIPISTLLNSLTPTATNYNVYSAGAIALRYFEKQCGNGALEKLNKFLATSDAATYQTYFDEGIRIASGGKFGDATALTAAVQNEFANLTPNRVIAKLKEVCDIDLSNADTGAITGSDAGDGLTKNEVDIIDESGPFGKMPFGETVINGLRVLWPNIGACIQGGMSLQIGSRSNQVLLIDLPQMDSGTLGIANLSLRTQKHAKLAINKFDKAVDVITSQLAKVGACQSRLEYTIDNLTTTQENLTSADSVIRDANMAQEMTNFVKNNILRQTSTAILSQVQQIPQGMLSLLQK